MCHAFKDISLLDLPGFEDRKKRVTLFYFSENFGK